MDRSDGYALETFRLGKRYRRGREWALADVDLSIPAGSTTALVGPNGAGKSTLIRAWVGFEPPTAGRVAVQGIDPWRDRAAAVARIGYVPQAASLYRPLTVADHLALAGSLRPRFDRALAARRLDELGIPLGRRTDELSGGQQAQVGLALALGTRAPVLLLDEPLASLDPLARRELLAVLMEAVRADGSTALLASHIVTDVEEACDRLIVLGGGRVLLHDSVEGARRTHRVDQADAATTPGQIAAFRGVDGRTLALTRSDDASLRPATLEEIVIGYLASGRTPVGAASAASSIQPPGVAA